MEERWQLQSAVHDWCARSEPRVQFFAEMVGPVSTRERTSIEPMALQVAGGTMRGLQRCISAVRWDEAQMRWHSPQRVAEERGAPDGVRRFDETGVVNKGQDSVGVARQSCGPLGTVAHCPVGGGLARPHGRGMPAWTSGGSCRKWGGRTPLRPAGPGATCPPH
jgi:DDE superfamily endonuclease